MTEEQKEKLVRIIDAGYEVFHKNGYKLAQMSDVASVMNGSVGSIYSYVKGKKALFDLCFLESFVDNFLNTVTELPFEQIEHQLMLDRYIASFLEQNSALQKDFYVKNPPLSEVIEFLFRHVTKFWRGIRMLDSSAKQWPLLFDFYRLFRTEAYQGLSEYLVRGMENGKIRRLKEPSLSARLLIENIAYFAMHRRYDMILHDMDENSAYEVTLDAMVHAFQTEKGE